MLPTAESTTETMPLNVFRRGLSAKSYSAAYSGGTSNGPCVFCILIPTNRDLD